MDMLATAKETLERKLATPRAKGYTSLKMSGVRTDGSDRYYDEQLRSDGWHLDEAPSDDELDFALPPSRPRQPESRCLPACCTICCVIS